MKGDKGKQPIFSAIHNEALLSYCPCLEFAGTLLGFDDYVSRSALSSSCDIEHVTNPSLRHGAGRRDRIVRFLFYVAGDHNQPSFAADIPCSDYSGSNTKLPKILLNGNNICMVTTVYSDGVFLADSLPAYSRR